ncbi:MAG: hypothetical protein LBK58_05335, partial [Prevotellaceae bacterium]|nr:hypothetical protein [Prevotellaceae bacterium]
ELWRDVCCTPNCATLVRGYPYLTPYGVSLQCTKLPRTWYNEGRMLLDRVTGLMTQACSK